MPKQPAKSLTPETDEKQYSIQQLEQFGIKYPFNTLILCSASFARSLELRLNAALAENENLNNVRLAALKATSDENLYLAHRILSNNNVEGVNKENAVNSAIQSTNKPK